MKPRVRHLPPDGDAECWRITFPSPNGAAEEQAVRLSGLACRLYRHGRTNEAWRLIGKTILDYRTKQL